ncbi:MAG: 1-acyl-sn-glycerol-3-phosphate acyltransferase [bacterium]
MNNFDDIRPYHDHEVADVLRELNETPEFINMLRTYFPFLPLDQMDAIINKINSKTDMQMAFVKPVLENLVATITGGLTVSGVDNVRDKSALLMSNHRDIVIDPSFLCLSMLQNGIDSAEVAIGDNLLSREWIMKLVRLNKCFIVKRGLQPRETLKAFMQLSSYIRYAITEKNQSVWIAQREGRAKDSNDRTQNSIIKMFALSGRDSFIENISVLNISPVTISYEYDPCDYLKAKEFQQKRDNADFAKSKEDDLLSMQVGIMGKKGRVHYAFSSSINPLLESLPKELSNKEQAARVCEICDNRIFSNYVIYPVNRLAYELLTGNNEFASQDTAEERAVAEGYLRGQLAKIDLPNRDDEYLWGKLLEMYANPFINYLSTK